VEGGLVIATSTSSYRGRARAGALCACALLLAAMGCSSTPAFRPASPMPEGRTLSVGVAAGAQGGVGSDGAATVDRAGALSSVFVRYAVTDNLELTALGHGGAAAGIVQSPSGAYSVKYGGAIYGGNAGARFVYPVLDGLRVGAGFYLDYLEQSYTLTTQRHVTAMVTLPAAERVYDGIWVYVRPMVGLSISLYEEAQLPFFGVMECPVGVSWQMTDQLTLLAEGGYYLPTNGVNALVGLSAQF